MRRVGVEARPGLVQGAPMDGGGGSSSEQNDRKDDSDDPPNGDSDGPPNNDADDPQTEDAENPSTGNQPPLIPESTDTHKENQVLLNAKFCATNSDCLAPIISRTFFEKRQHIVLAAAFLHFTCEYLYRDLLSLYLVMLYINSEYSWKPRQCV